MKAVLPGKVILVGAGPGDPELLTLRAVRVLSAADAILYDRLVDESVLGFARPDAVRVFAGKSKGCHSLSQDRINELLFRTALSHPLVCRLKGGDPFIYGRGGEEMEYLRERGIECEIVPGVTAASGVAAAMKIPLTHRDFAGSLRFHSAHRKRDEMSLDFGDLSETNLSHVFYMGGTRLREIREAFLQCDPLADNLPVAIVRRATFPDQQYWMGTLACLEEHGLHFEAGDPVLVVVGQVVSCSNFYTAIPSVELQHLQA